MKEAVWQLDFMYNAYMAKLSVIGTPIGNLGDISLRALETLKTADFIICEDTRVTKRLLDQNDISKPLISYHSKSNISRVDEIIDLLKNNKNLALVSDAGTPGISDPGSALIHMIRETMKEEILSGVLKIEAIPGPSALIAALSIAGVKTNVFTFFGFLPHKKGREKILSEVIDSTQTCIFYESTHRIINMLEKYKSLYAIRGDTKINKKITICREITKIYEEVLCGSSEELLQIFESNREKQKGEFVVIVHSV